MISPWQTTISLQLLLLVLAYYGKLCDGYVSLTRTKVNQAPSSTSSKVNSWSFLCAVRKKARDNVGKQEEEVGGRQRRWDKRMQQLLEYNQTYGTVNVPLNPGEEDKELRALGAFTNRVRRLQTTLSEERRAQLTAMGFELDGVKLIEETRDRRWDDMYDRLLHYKKVNGDCRVPAIWEDDPPLGFWVQRQRNKIAAARR